MAIRAANARVTCLPELFKSEALPDIAAQTLSLPHPPAHPTLAQGKRHTGVTGAHEMHLHLLRNGSDPRLSRGLLKADSESLFF